MPDPTSPNPASPDTLRLSDPGFREAGPVRLREDREAGAVLAAALRLGVAHALPLGAAVLAIAGPLVLAGALARVVGGAEAGVAVGSVLDLVASVLVAASVFGFLRLSLAGAPAGVADVWEAAKPLAWPLFAFSAVGAVALVLLAMPLVAAGTALAAASPPLAVVFGVAALAAFALTALPVFALGTVAVALDRLPTGEAFTRAAVLVRAQWPRVAAATVLVLLLTGFVLVAVVGALAGTVGEAGIEATGGTTVAGALGGAALTLATLPINVGFTLAWTVLYGSLVERAEGVAMADDLAALAAGDALHAPARDGMHGDAHGMPGDEQPGSELPGGEARTDPGRTLPAGGFRGGDYAEPEKPGRDAP